MKKAIVMTLCAAMAVGMIGSVSTVYAADADIASDDAIKKAYRRIPPIHGSFAWTPALRK